MRKNKSSQLSRKTALRRAKYASQSPPPFFTRPRKGFSGLLAGAMIVLIVFFIPTFLPKFSALQMTLLAVAVCAALFAADTALGFFRHKEEFAQDQALSKLYIKHQIKHLVTLAVLLAIVGLAAGLTGYYPS